MCVPFSLCIFFYGFSLCEAMVSSHLVGEIVAVLYITGDLAANTNCGAFYGFLSVYVYIEDDTMVRNSKWIPPLKNIHKYGLEYTSFQANKNELRCQQDAINNHRLVLYLLGVKFAGFLYVSSRSVASCCRTFPTYDNNHSIKKP